MSTHDEQDAQLTSPTVDRVLRRSFCLSAVVCRAFIDDPADEQSRSLHERIRPWLATVGAESELESWELSALAQPLGQLESQTRVDASWASEGLAVLSWALSRYELLPHDSCVDPQALTNALEFLQPSAVALGRAVTLRSAHDIQLAADRAFAIHWRLRQFSLSPVGMDFGSFAQTAWFGPLNIQGVPLAESDLAIHGVPLARAAAAAQRAAASIAIERHKAFNWLLGHHEIYSEVGTST